MLAAWQNYYVIIGSSAVGLIGIQFVVITLIASMRRSAPADTVNAFSTPTVVHLTSALLISAIMTAAWPSVFAPSIALAVCGFGGVIYGALVIRRTRLQTGYRPLWQDWLWYSILPLLVYSALGASAVLLRTATLIASFVIGACALALLLIAIHNAWDTVTHIIVAGGGSEQ